ncbi:AMP-binding protein [Metapseudomonas resinovorans]|uniref:Putative fatty-acid--CoA ligase n=1 Tax=Metapseudomonas resinovorans NBRC 106553 TaxID=1245471 RepID=S6AH72_METRE|nr:AMP-binding protein [Pseudomonas resinovorans]BAN49842.1 putative fatty-acid--CoA ligase [Pseudomonas resinovorans NBRC 106553]
MRPDDLREVLRQHAGRLPQPLALRGDTRRYTYAQLLAEVERRETLLRTEAPGVFALGLDNGPEALLWDLAALLSDRPCLTLPPFFSPSQRAHCLEQCQVTLAVAEGEVAGELESAGFQFDGLFWRKPGNGRAALPFGTAKVTYTSGTTGQPKGVCLGAPALLRVAQELEIVSRATAPTHYLAVLPLAVLLENLGVYAALLAGACVTLLPQRQLGIQGASGVDWPKLLATLILSGAQSLILVPQLLLGLVTAIERGHLGAAQFRFVAVGGARVSKDLLDRAARVGLPVYEGYGLSECASVVCLNRPGANRPGSVGPALPHVRLRLAADGEVEVSGCALLGYLGEAPFEGQWWPTGDLGDFDADGYLYLKGRKKHQFITSFGRNLNPDWIEAELTQGGVIAQAFVHGEGLPGNLALLWPINPHCDRQTLVDAVAKANAALPDYARISAWRRLEAPLTAADGLLTSNGRPRREAILARYRTTLLELDNEVRQ